MAIWLGGQKEIRYELTSDREASSLGRDRAEEEARERRAMEREREEEERRKRKYDPMRDERLWTSM